MAAMGFRHRISRVARSESGFTLIEMLIVVIVMGILTMIALPSYLTLRTRAYDATAKSNITELIPSVGAYYQDNQTYVGMTLAGLKASYDSAIDTTKYVLPVADLTATSYCIQASSGTRTWRKNGPVAALQNLACP
jgi:type IV pilus assembly protein PilA